MINCFINQLKIKIQRQKIRLQQSDKQLMVIYREKMANKCEDFLRFKLLFVRQTPGDLHRAIHTRLCFFAHPSEILTHTTHMHFRGVVAESAIVATVPWEQFGRFGSKAPWQEANTSPQTELLQCYRPLGP